MSKRTLKALNSFIHCENKLTELFKFKTTIIYFFKFGLYINA